MDDYVGTLDEYLGQDELSKVIIENTTDDYAIENVGSEKTFNTFSTTNTDEASVPHCSSTSAEGDSENDAENTKNDVEGDPEKESELASHIADAIKDKLCFDEVSGDWFLQANGLWSVISEKRALKHIMRELKRHMPLGYSISKLNNIKSFLSILLLLDHWETHRNLLPLKNGVLDVESLRLFPYDNKFRFNWQLPYDYDPSAKISVIKQWLWDASGNDIESVNTIRAFFKMALVGGDIQKFLELIGPGGTGKSTLLRLLVAFIGVMNHTATDLKNLETNRFEAAGFYGKRLVLISDSSRYGGEVAVLKALTGGDPIRLEKKNMQQSGSFVYEGVVVVASNEPIQTADYTSGLIRRRMPVNFNRKVTDSDKAKWSAVGGIECVMQKELPGLLNWVLAMTDAEVKAVIGGINGSMTLAQRAHLCETNKIAGWLDECAVVTPDKCSYIGKSLLSIGSIELADAIQRKLYPNYQQWCTESGAHPVALQRFSDNLMDVCSQLKIAVEKPARNKHGQQIKGISIRKDSDSEFPTPVTNKLIGAEENVSGAEVVLKQTLVSVDGVEGAEENQVVKNNSDLEFF